jgi:hypothetical protein
MKKVLFIFFIVIFALSFTQVNAQVQSPIDGVTISSDPVNPAPNNNVKVNIESFVLDLNSASIVWLSNGKNIASGIGKTEITVKSPEIGKKLVLSVIIKINSGREIQKAIVIESGSVDLIWETSGYTPPFFKGKNPFVYQNSIKVTAIPHLSIDGVNEVDPKKLIYQWKEGGKYIEGASGYGKQSAIIYSNNIPKDIDISLNVYTQDQAHSADKTFTFSPTEPSVGFYEIDSLYGILLNKDITDKFYMKNSEAIVIASPFGFDNIKNVKYNWQINNVEQPDLINNQSITLRTKGDADGSSNIAISISNNKLLQGVSSLFTAVFKKKTVESSDNITF